VSSRPPGQNTVPLPCVEKNHLCATHFFAITPLRLLKVHRGRVWVASEKSTRELFWFRTGAPFPAIRQNLARARNLIVRSSVFIFEARPLWPAWSAMAGSLERTVSPFDHRVGGIHRCVSLMDRRSNSHPSAHKFPNKYCRADVRARRTTVESRNGPRRDPHTGRSGW